MCDFRVWFQSDEDVYVLQCTECNIFQVRLRKAAFMFHVFEYKIFREVVADIHHDTAYNEQGQRCIPTFNGSMQVLLDKDEITALYHLLDAADTEMKIAQLADMFS